MRRGIEDGGGGFEANRTETAKAPRLIGTDFCGFYSEGRGVAYGLFAIFREGKNVIGIWEG